MWTPCSTPDQAQPYRVYVDGTKVEMIGTGAITDLDLDGLDAREILFVAAHRWALETATPVILLGDHGTRATVPMARASALVAMKLGAVQGRRAAGGVDKRASDAWDIYRLLTDVDVATTALEIQSALPGLQQAVAAAVRDILVDHAGRTHGWLRSGDSETASIRAEDLVAAGTDLLVRLR
ncbi:MAG: hypothetical protein JWL70_2677 [Acidimicrobiia bacterium]|nr:hypothetical protein [Acidimicrobiia bacterium]